jgi:hypothetical protein
METTQSGSHCLSQEEILKTTIIDLCKRERVLSNEQLGKPPILYPPPPLLLSPLYVERTLTKPVIALTSVDDLCDSDFIVNYEIDCSIVTDSQSK